MLQHAPETHTIFGTRSEHRIAIRFVEIGCDRVTAVKRAKKATPEIQRFSTQIKSDDPGAERSRPALWSVFVFFRGRSEVLETVRPTVEEWS
jgi:hypothetical protein